MVKCVAGVLAGFAVAAQGARISRHQESEPGKTLAGVPVLNYNSAYGGRVRASADQKEHWVVFAKKGADTENLETLCQSSGACEKTGHPSEGGVPFFEVFTTETALEKVLSQAPGQFEFVEPDGVFSLDDPEEEVGAQNAPWGLNRVGVNTAAHTGKGAHIYVLDTGVRCSHKDFGGRAFAAVDTTSNSLVECNRNDFACAADRQGHGTHCAGTAGGKDYGVAPDAFVYAVKVLSDQGGGSFSWSFWALDWLATKAEVPRISSMSLGGRGVVGGMEASVSAAVDAGVVVVVAGGNSNADACGFSPAFAEKAITVGSTTNRDRRSSFSNYGRCTNIWAPGSDILSASHTGDGRSVSLSGTSMACPHVSGAVALLFEELGPNSPASSMVGVLQTRSTKNAITGLRGGDVNYLLSVGQ
jgi:subtilisin family serine protease